MGFLAGGGEARAQDEDAEAVRQAKALSRAFRAAAKTVLPTVVKVKTTQKLPEFDGQSQGENPFEGTPFEDFFDPEEMPFPSHPRLPRPSGVGSGVIIDPGGIILTNNHVVENASEVVIELSDGRELKATQIKGDRQSDLAVVRIDPKKPLPAARLGDSDRLEIGDWVMAIGNPFELNQTVSAGIISGKGRVLGQIKRAQFLQTDAAINPGNSGGPLVNLDGEVVGINTAIASNNGGYQGVGFAIPVNLAKWVTEQLIASGSVKRAYLGVGIVQITGELSAKLGVPPSSGVLVSEVFPNTPAAEAGFQEGDIIVSFGGKTVKDPRQLQEVVERAPFDERQDVKVLRNREPRKLQVMLRSLPREFGSTRAVPRAETPEEVGPAYKDAELGLEVAALTEELAKAFDYEAREALVITAIQPQGIAAAAGLREGMLILRVGDTEVDTIDQFKKAVQKEDADKGILLLVRTAGGNRFIVLKKP
jgi:serine protease Do